MSAMKSMTINELMTLLKSRIALGRNGDRVLAVMIHAPGSIGGTPCVPVKAMHFGIDWDSGKLLIELERPVTSLTAEQVKDITESVRKGSSWHAYQEYKRLKEEARADQERLDWLFRQLPGTLSRQLLGELSNTGDMNESRAALDAAIDAALQERSK